MTNAPGAREAVGICLGASTISAVKVKTNGTADPGRPAHGAVIDKVILKTHEGNPRLALEEVIADLAPDGAPVLVTGRKFRHLLSLSAICEPEAVENALAFLARDGAPACDAVVSAGGETFIVYAVDVDGKIQGLSTGNKCASGTGEFFLQQIRRMNLGVEEAVAAAERGIPYGVSGRCSVFLKSACTPALNKGESIENVTS